MKVRGIGKVDHADRGGEPFTPGRIVRGRVLSRTGEGRFKVSVSGFLLEADSDLPLEAGQRLVARVEVAGQKILLRIQDDSSENPPQNDDETQEIRRILEGLGLTPDILEVKEFQERLERYRPHGSLAGVEPSDVWILAILWARGVHSGSDAFALSSFYLRRLSLEENVGSLTLPREDDLALALGLSETDPVPVNPQIPEITGNSLVSGIEDLKRDCVKLLNREGESCGKYRLAEAIHTLTLQQNESLLYRWTDNPIKPGYVLEISRSGLEATAILYLVQGGAADAETTVNHWRSGWHKLCKMTEWQDRGFVIGAPKNREALRFTFWKTWLRQDDYIRQA